MTYVAPRYGNSATSEPFMLAMHDHHRSFAHTMSARVASVPLAVVVLGVRVGWSIRC